MKKKISSENNKVLKDIARALEIFLDKYKEHKVVHVDFNPEEDTLVLNYEKKLSHEQQDRLSECLTNFFKNPSNGMLLEEGMTMTILKGARKARNDGE